MTDPYLPALASFSFTKTEQKAITIAMAKHKPWKETNADITSAKAKIRDFHLARRKNTCCYCCTNLHGGGYFMIDREHVLPKGKFKSFTFAIWNLSVACKRCNMEMKGELDSYVVDKSPTAPFHDSANYRFVHPNFDDWEAHLYREMSQINMRIVVKFAIVDDSAKGRFTHEFFKLKQLETDSFDTAQGGKLKAAQTLTEGALEAKAIAHIKGQ